MDLQIIFCAKRNKRLGSFTASSVHFNWKVQRFVYTALQKFGNTLEKWTISHFQAWPQAHFQAWPQAHFQAHFQAWPQAHFQAVQILFGEETVSWHHVCHGMVSPITRPQPNWATRNWTVMSVRSVQPVWIIFGQSFRRLGVIYQVNAWINWPLGCPDYAEL